jgi:hypothetical protein
MRTFEQKHKHPLQSKATSIPDISVSHPHRSSILGLQSTIGNQAMLRTLQPHTKEPDGKRTPAARAIPAKLTINTPGDQHEREADRISAQAMRTSDKTSFRLQRKAAGPVNTTGAEAPPIVHDVLRSPGHPLDASTRAFLEPRFGHDFSNVQVHTDANAAASARSVGARAYTAGAHVVFGSGEYAPWTESGRKLLGHELAHVVQQSQAPAPAAVQRAILPEDVSSELVGQEFTLRKDFVVSGKTLAAGAIVTVVSWSNTADTVEVRNPSVAGTFNVPKVLLLPKQANVSGIAPYGTDLEQLEKVTEKHGAKLEEFKKTPAKDRMKDFAQDVANREADQAKMAKNVNTRLIQGSMLNRFDASIKQWVDFYNNQFGFNTKDPLDPNLVKAIMYKESGMGTNEPFMSDPPTHPIMSRFNLIQAVDSPINDIVPIMREMSPSLFAKYHIENIEKDLMAVEVEFDKLKKNKSRNATEQTRFTLLSSQEDHGNWKPWFFSQPGFNDAVVEFLATVDGGKKHSEDYDFWIRAGIRALFEKRVEIKATSWEKTAEAYNGSAAYRDAVVAIRKGALDAQKKGKVFIPPNL